MYWALSLDKKCQHRNVTRDDDDDDDDDDDASVQNAHDSDGTQQTRIQ